jgi:hypothetical protein
MTAGVQLKKKIISVRESQGAWHQDELIDRKVTLTLSLASIQLLVEVRL